MPKPKVRLQKRKWSGTVRTHGVFTSSRVYLWPLMSISHISLIAAILWRHYGPSPQSAFQRIVLDPIKITSSYCIGAPESSALSTELAGDLALICSIAVVTLCLVSDSVPLLKSGWWLLAIQPGILGAEDICEQHQRAAFKFVNFPCWSTAELSPHRHCTPLDAGKVVTQVISGHLDTSCLWSKTICTCRFKCRISGIKSTCDLIHFHLHLATNKRLPIGRITNLIAICLGFSGPRANQGQRSSSREAAKNTRKRITCAL